MSLPASRTDTVAKISRAISNVLMKSEQKPIEEEEEVDFEDPDERPVSSSRFIVQLSVDIRGDAGDGNGGLRVEPSSGT